MRRVLVIGATSAIATAMCQRMTQDGDRLYLMARDEAKLATLSASLGKKVSGFCQADFNNTASAVDSINDAHQSLGGFDLVLIAHGYIGDQLRSEVDYSHAEEVFQTNFLSVVAQLIPISQLMEKQGHGKIAVMTSVAGDRGRPRNYTYGTAKGALNTYLQGLRSRLWGSGVEVYSFKLGPVVTPMTADHEKNFSFSTIDRVVNIMLKGLQRGSYTRYVPGYWYWVMLVVRWLPEPIFQRVKFLSGR